MIEAAEMQNRALCRDGVVLDGRSPAMSGIDELMSGAPFTLECRASGLLLYVRSRLRLSPP